MLTLSASDPDEVPEPETVATKPDVTPEAVFVPEVELGVAVPVETPAEIHS
ncbi:MAG: hypothetical protein RIR50_1260 [Pseudomonadota bacterium]